MEDMAHNMRGMLHFLWWILDDFDGFSKVEISYSCPATELIDFSQDFGTA